jgi:hypothetical protein
LVGSVAGAEAFTAVSSPGRETIAFQPTRSANVSSSTLTVRGSSTAAVSGSTTRVVFSPPWPGGLVTLAAPAGVSATARPSTVSRSRFATSAFASKFFCSVGISAASRT